MEAQMLLRNPDIYPSNEVLENMLGDTVYNALESFIQTVINNEYELIPEWKFYNDGKAWFCKIIYKKKTILWLSVWEGFFRIGFYFTEKHIEGILALDISKTIKDDFVQAKPVGRLLPMVIDVSKEEQLEDILAVVRYKKSLK